MIEGTEAPSIKVYIYGCKYTVVKLKLQKTILESTILNFWFDFQANTK